MRHIALAVLLSGCVAEVEDLDQMAPPIANPPLTGDCASGDLNIWLVADESGSLGNSVATAQAAWTNLVGQLSGTGANLGIVSTTNVGTVLVPMTPVTPTTASSVFAPAIAAYSPRENTNLHGALLAVQAEHAVEPADLVLMTLNGVPNLCGSVATGFDCIGDVPAAVLAAQDVSNTLRADGVRTMLLTVNMASALGVQASRQLVGRPTVRRATASDLNLYASGNLPEISSLPGAMNFIGRRICPSAQ